MQKKLLFLIVVLLVTSCGYKPSSVYIQHLFEDKIYVEVEVDRVEPENAPFVKDEMNRLVYTRFKGRVVSEEEADNYIKISYKGSYFSPLAYRDGYVTRYRANIRVRFKMMTKDGEMSRSIVARHEDDIQASSLASSTLRTEAIRKGLEKALDQFLAYASAKGLLLSKKSNVKKKIETIKTK